jgi:hypothetical protein
LSLADIFGNWYFNRGGLTRYVQEERWSIKKRRSFNDQRVESTNRTD